MSVINLERAVSKAVKTFGNSGLGSGWPKGLGEWVMGELLDRNYQREILRRLSDNYPSSVSQEELTDNGGNSLIVNVRYLEEHGLVSADWSRVFKDPPYFATAVITARGLDFLQDDGGLGAILNVVTVRFDADTIKALMMERVRESDEDESVKAKAIAVIKDIPADTIKLITSKLIDKGLQNVPAIAAYLIENLS